MRNWLKMTMLAGLVGAGAGILLWNAGCGIVGAPVLLPAAVAANHNFRFQGTVVDDQGRPLDGVIAELEAEHYGWTPVEGGQSTNNSKVRQVNKTFTFDARGTEFKVKFSKNGYYPAEYFMSSSYEGEIVMGSSAYDSPAWKLASWPMATDLPVVLLPHNGPDTPVRRLNQAFDYSDYPQADTIGMLERASRTGRNHEILEMALTRRSVADAASFPAGTMYLTLTAAVPVAIDKKGTLDPAELNLPEEVTLHIAGADGGFVRIVPKLGYPPLRTTEEAPAEGYVSELRIVKERLREMRGARSELVREANEFFYFRANGFYGKGVFSWARSGSHTDKEIWPLQFKYVLVISTQAGSRELRTRERKPCE